MKQSGQKQDVMEMRWTYVIHEFALSVHKCRNLESMWDYAAVIQLIMQTCWKLVVLLMRWTYVIHEVALSVLNCRSLDSMCDKAAVIQLIMQTCQKQEVLQMGWFIITSNQPSLNYIEIFNVLERQQLFEWSVVEATWLPSFNGAASMRGNEWLKDQLKENG